MANITTKSNLAIKGIISLEDNQIRIEIDGLDAPINLIDYLSEFDGKACSITVAHSEEYA